MTIENICVADVLKNDYVLYAWSTVIGRSLPDAIDGLKPVQRRILWAMHQLGLRHDTKFRKCSLVTGEVMSRYHPHGSSYDALARMAQPWYKRHTLVDGHGNFGSPADPPAAERYTECRLSEISSLVLLADEPLHMRDNYDCSTKEPIVLEPRLPSLLLNGSKGIAVGFGCMHAPYNGRDVCDAVTAFLRGETVARIIPDLPEGGLIIDDAGLDGAFYSGHGCLRLLPRSDEPSPGVIELTQLPYGMSADQLCLQIYEADIPHITSIRDETDRTGQRVIVEYSAKRNPDVPSQVLRIAQTTFSVNAVAIADNAPQLLGVRNVIEAWWNRRRATLLHQFEQMRLATEARLAEARRMLLACDKRDFIMAAFAAATSREDLEQRLGDLSFVAAMPLYYLTRRQQYARDVSTLTDELRRISQLEPVTVALEQVAQLRDVFDERRTHLVCVVPEPVREPEERPVGRCTLDTNEYGLIRVLRGRRFNHHSEDDFVYSIGSGGFVGSRQCCHISDRFEIPSILFCAQYHVAAIFPGGDPTRSQILIVTGGGRVVRYEWEHVRNGTSAINLRNGDRVVAAMLVNNDDVITVAADGGGCISFYAAEVPMSSRRSKGVTLTPGHTWSGAELGGAAITGRRGRLINRD